MNEVKLQKMIEDAVQLLSLNEKQANYLDMLVNLSYNQGRIDQAHEAKSMLIDLKEKIYEER